jgi:transcriptional regulator of nitric oxide reductase
LIVAEKSATFKNVATKDSHLDCRAPLTLIVALQLDGLQANQRNPNKAADSCGAAAASWRDLNGPKSVKSADNTPANPSKSMQNRCKIDDCVADTAVSV